MQLSKFKSGARFILPAILSLSFMGFISLRYSHVKKEAKRHAEAYLSALVGKNTFFKFYVFDMESLLSLKDGSMVYWKESTKKPVYFHMRYKLRKNSFIQNDDIRIELDEDFKLVKMYPLVDTEFLKYMSLDNETVNALIDQYNLKVEYARYAYDSIPGRLTRKPYLELRAFDRAFPGAGKDCMVRIDSLYRIDISDRKLISRTTQSMEVCSLCTSYPDNPQ